MGVLHQITKNDIFRNSQSLLYKSPKDGDAKAPPVLPIVAKHMWDVSGKIIKGVEFNYYQSGRFCAIIFKNGCPAVHG